MLKFRLATASVNQTPLDWKGNTARILACIEELAVSNPQRGFSGNPDLILFPELSISGYGCEDAFHSLDLIKRSSDHLFSIAEKSAEILPDTLIYLGLPFRHNDFIYNSMAVIHNGDVIGIIPKRNLAGDGLHYEPRWFAYDRGEVPEVISIAGKKAQFGSLLIEYKGVKIGTEICEDSWVASRPALRHLRHGADIILNPAASHFSLGKQNIRRHLALESSRSLCTVFATVNLLGNEAGRVIYDGGSIIASNGELLLETPRFSFQDYELCQIELDIDKNRVQRARIYSYREQDYLEGAEGQKITHVVVRPGGKVPEPATAGNSSTPFSIAEYYNKIRKELRKSENLSECQSESFHIGIPLSRIRNELEFLHAVSLGLFDYFRKSRAKGFTVSLSGGADSSSIIVLIHRMLVLALQQLGPSGTVKRLGIRGHFLNPDGSVKKEKELIWKEFTEEFRPAEEPASGPETLKKELERIRMYLLRRADILSSLLLHTIYQASPQSGSITRTAARELAGELNTNHHEFSIGDVTAEYLRGIESVLGRSLTWETDDLALQNIQARARSPMAWLLANATGSLLLSTSNRSEAAVGYCTMDGDTSGGLAPIAGVSKDFIRRWLRFMEKDGDPVSGPVRNLSYINAQIPTAELRPAEAAQTDEKDLMPYEILDRIERLAVLERRPPLEVYNILKDDYRDSPEYHPSQLKLFTVRYFTLWSVNQWKRERYAPSFHLDDENLDPRSWYRFPILSGGYEEELEELRNSDEH